MKLTRARSLVFAAVLSVVLVLSVAYYWPIQEPYHPLNPEWNGSSKIANVAQNTTLLLSYDKALQNRSSLLAIIGPSTEFSNDESSDIRGFLEAGGTVLLADDFGTGNSLLEALNVSARFSRQPLADLYYYSKNPSFPLIIDFSPSPVTTNLTTIVLDRPSYIEVGNSSHVNKLASSSPFSFIDLKGENRPLANETIDSYPVLASISIGRGSLVLIADAGMFINEMIDLYDNMQLFQNLLERGDGSLFFDVVHLARAPLTNWRIILKDELNSVRGFFVSNRQSLYIPLLVVLVLVLSFSFEVYRLARSRRAAK